MAQYRAGKASVTNDSATVTGSGTFWLANISQGDAFTVAGSNVIYDVASVQSDTQLTLSTPYSGTTISEATYAVTRDFTSPDNFPELVAGDIETPTIITRAIRKIQQKFNNTLLRQGGTTDNRPQSPSDYECYFDTDLGQPIWYSGTSWVDSSGTEV